MSVRSILEGKIDTECACGWKLPMSVTPQRDEAVKAGKSSEDFIIPNACVTLRCPECGEGHVFVQPHQKDLFT